MRSGSELPLFIWDKSELDLIVQWIGIKDSVLTPSSSPSPTDDGLPTSPKQQRDPPLREDDCEEETKQNYEDWKRKILENALKAKSSG